MDSAKTVPVLISGVALITAGGGIYYLNTSLNEVKTEVTTLKEQIYFNLFMALPRFSLSI